LKDLDAKEASIKAIFDHNQHLLQTQKDNPAVQVQERVITVEKIVPDFREVKVLDVEEAELIRREQADKFTARIKELEDQVQNLVS